MPQCKRRASLYNEISPLLCRYESRSGTRQDPEQERLEENELHSHHENLLEYEVKQSVCYSYAYWLFFLLLLLVMNICLATKAFRSLKNSLFAKVWTQRQEARTFIPSRATHLAVEQLFEDTFTLKSDYFVD